jgi:hypothetical protein
MLDFDTKSLSLVTWSLATLGWDPGSAWLTACEAQAACIVRSLQAAELAVTLWALSQLRQQQPHELQLGRLIRSQEDFLLLDYQLLTNPKLFKVVRKLTMGPQGGWPGPEGA